MIVRLKKKNWNLGPDRGGNFLFDLIFILVFKEWKVISGMMHSRHVGSQREQFKSTLVVGSMQSTLNGQLKLRMLSASFASPCSPCNQEKVSRREEVEVSHEFHNFRMRAKILEKLRSSNSSRNRDRGYFS